MRADDPVGQLTRHWLKMARVDLHVAEKLAADPSLEPWVIGFHAQQAVEKSLKSILVAEQIDFPRTHDLEILLGRVPPTWAIAIDSSRLSRLSDFGAATRYPEEDWNRVPAPADDEVRNAVELAAEVYGLVSEGLRTRRIVDEGGVDQR